MTESRLLLSWFDSHARPFLELYAAERVQPLISDARRLQQLLGLPREAVICCLGNSGVGKSTLINALVAGETQLLPAGGTGPLTALATVVKYGEHARFQAQYHKPHLVWRIVLPIMGACMRERSSTAVATESAAEELNSFFKDAELSQDDIKALADEAGVDAASDQSRMNEFVKMARKLVTGDQFSNAPNTYLVDCLRIALDRNPQFGSEPLPEHLPHLERLRSALKLGQEELLYVRDDAGDPRGFLSDLRVHAIGSLAPLIAKLEVEWPSHLLREGLEIVDLPGVGIAGDMYRRITQEFVRERARAILLVVDRAGMAEVSLDLLRSSGYWDRLVGAAYEPDADPCALLIAVTKVDEVVLEEFGALPPTDRPKKFELLQQTMDKMEHDIRQQTIQQLAMLGESSSSDLNKARELARAQLLQNLEVFPVAAPDYRRIVMKDEEDPPHVARREDHTRVPRLADSLRRLAREMQDKKAMLIAAVRDRLTRGIQGELAIIESQWRDEQRVVQEAEQLRQALDEAVRPWREELANRQGSFREFLQEAVKEKIAALVMEAREAAEDDVRRYLRSLRDYHWSTLRAAVRRGGTFAGSRKIDLPNDISDRFQEPMAGVWGMRLLKDVRKRTQEYAQDCAVYVGRVCTWARGQGGRVNPAILDRQEQRIKDQADQLKMVGREATDDLRKAVRQEVSAAILKPIQKRCERFVDEGNSEGPGVKNRILDLFDTLAKDSTKAAEAPARRILERRFEEVRTQIDAAFAEWADPIKETVEAIVTSNEQRLRRADAKRREKVLEELEQIKAATPELEVVAA